MEIRELHFHNWGRYGDLHVSRSFVKRLVQHTGLLSFYHHRGDPKALADIPVTHLPREKEWVGQASYVKGGELYINTWYGAGKERYRASRSDRPDDLVTFDTLYRLFDDAARKHLGFPLCDLGSLADFLPSVDFNAFPIIKASEFIHARPKTKRVFFDTVECLSGQAWNFPLLPVLRNVALRRPDVTFFYTWPGSMPREALPDNALWTRDVHGVKEGLDLNENAYISTFCDVIIGRNSSSYTFALLRQNLIERAVRFLEFSLLPFPVLLGPYVKPRIQPKCSAKQSRTTSRNEALRAVLAEVGSA